MQNRQSHASSLFLLELILAILFFSIASAVCVQLFVKAHLLSQDARALNHAVSECASVAETLDAASSAEEAMELLSAGWPEKEAAADAGVSVFEVFFDDSFAVVSADDPYSYYLHAALSQTDRMLTVHTGFYKAADGSAVYELTVSHHIP